MDDLLRLSRELAANILVHTDEIPIDLVVEQLRHDEESLLWYLHVLFAKQLESYCEERFKPLHEQQVVVPDNPFYPTLISTVGSCSI